MNIFNNVLGLLPKEISNILYKISLYEQEHLQEIRLRMDLPLCVVIQGQSFFVSKSGHTFSIPKDDVYIISREVLEKAFLSLSSYSLQAHQDELEKGFFSSNYGIRVGVSGEITQNTYNRTTYKNVYSLNIRIPREFYNICDEIINQVDILDGLLVVGKPNSGKTTFIRELARTLSSGMWGKSYRVTVIDERYEICGYDGNKPYFNMGYNADIISGENKAEAIEKAVRTLSPEVIVCDELGSDNEICEVAKALQCGTAFVATIHGKYNDYNNKRILSLLDTSAFNNIIYLDNVKSKSHIIKLISKEEYYDKVNRSLLNS